MAYMYIVPGTYPFLSRITSVQIVSTHTLLSVLVVIVADEFGREVIVADMREDRGSNPQQAKQYFEAIWNVSCCQCTFLNRVPVFQLK